MIIDVKPATTLAEAADQMEEAIGMRADHYVNVCDTVLSNWSMLCRSVDVDALLALAGEMEEFGNLPVKHPGVRVLHNDDFSRELGYARRIREALGVSDD